MQIDFYNGYVYVKLNRRGEDILRDYARKVQSTFPGIDAEAKMIKPMRLEGHPAWLELSLKTLVQVFGGNDLVGMGTPFEENLVHTVHPFPK